MAMTASHLRSYCIDIPPPGLFSSEPRRQRGKVLHLSFIDLKVGETVPITLLKEMCSCLSVLSGLFGMGGPPA